MTILNGTELSKQKTQELKLKIDKFKEKSNHIVSLAVILVGEDPASEIYVNMKHKACKNVGINSIVCSLSNNISQDELLSKINDFNNDNDIDGILVQLPLPKHISEEVVLESVIPSKDVDGFCATNTGYLWSNTYANKVLAPATPLGVITLLEHYDISLQGKEVVIVGTSNIVGKPLAGLFLNKNATITMCNIHTKDLKSHTCKADIVCVGIGKAKFITEDMIKEGAIVVDIGTNKLDGKLCGDVDFENVKNKTSYITPVPGGVGPMTIYTLLENTLKASINRLQIKDL